MVFILLWFAVWLTGIIVLALHNNDGWAFLAFLVMLSFQYNRKECKCGKPKEPNP